MHTIRIDQDTTATAVKQYENKTLIVTTTKQMARYELDDNACKLSLPYMNTFISDYEDLVFMSTKHVKVILRTQKGSTSIPER
jgi:hypothetical protein